MRTAQLPQREATATTAQLGVLLKHWRGLRGKSQLALALDANVSPRHVSFVESGRSQASRELLTTLADALQIPLRERNLLFRAAGFAPRYVESQITSAELAHVHSALERVLQHQEPYPAVVLDRHWNVVRANRAAPKLFSLFIDPAAQPQPLNLLRTMFSAGGMRPCIANWDVVSRELVQRVFREAVGSVPDDETMALLRELQAFPLVAQLTDSPMSQSLPVHPIVFRKRDLELSFFSMIISVGSPLDITAQELRIEAMFPTDAVTEAFAQANFRSDAE